MSSKKIIIHKYLPKCKTNELPPGFGDFLRGSVALYNYAKIYNFELCFDKEIHPIFKYFKNNTHFIIDDDKNSVVEELLPPLSYTEIDNKLIELFEKNESFSLITNSFYTKNNNVVENFGEISSDCKNFFKHILQPSFLLKNKLFIVFDRIYNIDVNSFYKVIHLRLGDMYIFNKINENNENTNKLLNNLDDKISNLLKTSTPTTQYILICDSNFIGEKLKEKHHLLYWSNNKTHLGGFEKNNDSICDTLIDFFVFSNAKEIFSFTVYNNQSGFSKMVSLIFDIKISNL
jgi:hypothetical protein